MSLKIIQWNIKGYINNYNELLLIIRSDHPHIICLQETHLKTVDNIPIPVNYCMYNENNSDSSFNRIFRTYIPQSYKRSVVVPILKQQSDRTLVKSYRPISLNSCCSKVLDKIVANRLRWFTENGKLLCSRQVGFTRERSVADNLLYLDNLITDSLSMRRHVSIISLDFAKAYDKIGVHAIIDQLKVWKLGPNIIRYIYNFMTNRQIKVRVENQLSGTYPLYNGIPQGSQISVILFLIAYNV